MKMIPNFARAIVELTRKRKKVYIEKCRKTRHTKSYDYLIKFNTGKFLQILSKNE